MADKTRATAAAQSAKSTCPSVARRRSDAAAYRACFGTGTFRRFTSTSTQSSEGGKAFLTPASRGSDEAQEEAVVFRDFFILNPLFAITGTEPRRILLRLPRGLLDEMAADSSAAVTRASRSRPQLLEEIEVPFPKIRLLVDVTTDASEHDLEKVKADLHRFCPISKVVRNSGTECAAAVESRLGVDRHDFELDAVPLRAFVTDDVGAGDQCRHHRFGRRRAHFRAFALLGFGRGLSRRRVRQFPYANGSGSSRCSWPCWG